MPTADRARPRRPRAGFRPDIEGLRAVAILTVLAYHAGLPVRGGFVGVDIFFVISGFLITGLLVTELDRSGSISWIRFVGRRIRRLLPAAVLVLVLTSLVSWFVVPGLRRRDIGVDVAAAALYVVNWVFARRETDYLASDVLPSPVQHFWSLAVEEQFYVIWPLLLIVLALVVRRPSRRVVALALGALVASSFVWSVWFSHTSPRPAFFTTTTRVWELGIGALLAVALAGRPRPTTPARGSAALGWVALAALVAVAAVAPAGHRLAGRVGPAAHPADRGAALGRLAGAGARPGAGARHRADGVGRWPVVLDLPLALAGHHPRRLDRRGLRRHHPVLGGGAAGARLRGACVAVVAVRRVPDPPRPWLRDRPRALLAAGLALSCVGVLAALPLLVLRSPFTTTPPGGTLPPLSQLGAATLQPGRAFVPVDDPGWVTPDPLVSGQDRPEADVDRCQVPVDATAPVACTFGDPQGATTVALVGDSKAMQWLPALEEAAATRGWRIVTYGKSSCAFSDAPAAQAGAAYPECDAWNAAVLDALRADPPDVVVTSGVAASAWTGDGTAREPLVEGYASRWTALADAGVPVVVVGDSPVSPDDLDVCAARHPTELTRCSFETASAVAGSGLAVQRDAVAAASAQPATCTCSTSPR